MNNTLILLQILKLQTLINRFLIFLIIIIKVKIDEFAIIWQKTFDDFAKNSKNKIDEFAKI